MQAFFHHMPFEEHDTHREFRLELRIGGEIFWTSLKTSAMEAKHARNFSSTVKRGLVTKMLDEFKHQIYEQIGR